MIRREQHPLHVVRIEKMLRRVRESVLGDHVLLSASVGHSAEPVTWDNRLALDYREISEGERWGVTWESGWFRLTGEVPDAWAGEQVVAELDFGGEGLVFSADGRPMQGITNGSVFAPVSEESVRRTVPLFSPAEGGEQVSLWVDAACNSLFGVVRGEDPARDDPARHGRFEGVTHRMRLAVWNEELWQLTMDIDVLLGLLKSLPVQDLRRERLLYGLSQMVDLYADNPARAAACRAHLAPLLASPAHATTITIASVGHAHLDVGWLWPVRESIRKAGRTFATQLDLIERYPGYVFGASQPQLYAFVKEHYPSLYERVKQAVVAGTFELQGAMWVEPDCNIISGESMVRQVLHGKNFYRDEFGADVRNLWVPDVFGYSAAMPQIMRRAGVDFFLTQKLSWSQFNRFPHTTFRWVGIDGSELLTHFPPEDTYNSQLEPSGMRKIEQQFEERGSLDEALCLFGIGDGGGGPSPRQIERGLRQRNLEGTPHVTFGRADRFFERLESQREQLPVWQGELYLELHRGTLTTQGQTKRGNRKLELALRAVEYLCSCCAPDTYPRATLDRVWKQLLTNQFHDILPGSSIRLVYEAAEADYREGLATCQSLLEQAAAELFTADADALTVVNTLNVTVTQPIELPEGWTDGLLDSQGQEVPVQCGPTGRCVAAVELPPQGVVVLERSGKAVQPDPVCGLVLENAWVRYGFGADGQLVEAFDKEAGRAILEHGEAGNVLSLYEDRPNAWDAWDIDAFYEQQLLERAQVVQVESMGVGVVQQGLRITFSIGVSTLVQEITLAANSKRLDFRTTVDWQERHRMLRVAFPVDVRSDLASFEIQYTVT